MSQNLLSHLDIQCWECVLHNLFYFFFKCRTRQSQDKETLRNACFQPENQVGQRQTAGYQQKGPRHLEIMVRIQVAILEYWSNQQNQDSEIGKNIGIQFPQLKYGESNLGSRRKPSYNSQKNNQGQIEIRGCVRSPFSVGLGHRQDWDLQMRNKPSQL